MNSSSNRSESSHAAHPHHSPSGHNNNNNDTNPSEEDPPLVLYRRQILFGVDLSLYPTHLQYLIPTLGLFLFMCLYGYLQELVVYGLFERKWSNLQTFLHFFGCILCAEIQSYFTSTRRYAKIKPLSYLTMGKASFFTAFSYYALLTFLKTATMTFTNLAMKHINYPAKTMCKSALPIVTMLMGILWFKKSYPFRDYLVSLLLVTGLYLFLAVDVKNSFQGTSIGLFYVTLSLLGAALVPMVQEHVMDQFEATPEELLYFSFLGSAIMSFIFTFISGEAIEGTLFLLRKGSLFMWICFTLFNTCGFLGAACSIALTARFGSVVNAITNTSRKAASIAISFLLFPERNTLHTQHVLGAGIFFTGILLRGVMKGELEAKKRRRSLGVKDESLTDKLLAPVPVVEEGGRNGGPSRLLRNHLYSRLNHSLSSSSFANLLRMNSMKTPSGA